MNLRDLSVEKRRVLFVDGDCGLCSRAALFVINHDSSESIYIGTLQSGLGQEVLEQLGLGLDVRGQNPSPMTIESSTLTVVLWDEGMWLTESAAVLRVLELCGGGWKLLAVAGRMIPQGLRDRVYRLVARNRHRFRKEHCRLPDERERQRFLDG